MNIMKATTTFVLVALSSVFALSCSNELTNTGAPVELVVTNKQKISQIDLAPNNDPDCEESIGTINMQVVPKNSTVTGNLVQVRVTRYRVSYRRLDGGTLIPAPFVRPIDVLIGVGETSDLTNFRIFERESVTQAPFAALLPQNGGRDPETGRSTVKMHVALEVFGETLAGDNVYGATTFQLDFCYDCGGCD